MNEIRVEKGSGSRFAPAYLKQSGDAGGMED